MKVAHRNTAWQHVAYSLIVVALLTVLIVVRRQLPTLLLGLVITLYVAGNTYLHYRRGDLERETVYEYLLTAAIAFVVLAGAMQ